MQLWEKIKAEFRRGNSALHQIIILVLSAFIFSTLIEFFGALFSYDAGYVLEYFYLPSNLSTLVTRPWTIVTNIFFHSGLRHLIGNAITLYFIGRILQDFLDFKQFWKLFIGGGLLGCIFFVLAYNVFPGLREVASVSTLVGASGGLAAIIAAVGIYLPHYTVRPFGLFDIQLRQLSAFLLFGMLTFPVISGNIGGFLAHLGGAVFGWLFIWHMQGKLDQLKKPRKAKPRMRKVEDTVRKHTSNKHTIKPEQEEIDAILDKISQSGYDSLSKEEKELLFKASE